MKTKTNKFKTGLILAGLSLIASCGGSLKTVDSTTDQASQEAPAIDRDKTVRIDLGVSEKDNFAFFGLTQATVTNTIFDVAACKSGYNPTGLNGDDNSLNLIQNDNSCLVKLVSLDVDGATYTPDTNFTTWLAGDFAIFKNTLVATDTLKLEVVTQLATVLAGAQTVHYQFGRIRKGTDYQIKSADIGRGVAVQVDQLAAPAFEFKTTLGAVLQPTDLGANGSGKWKFELACNTPIVGAAGPTAECGGQLLSNMDMLLVDKDEFTASLVGATPLLSDFDAMFAGTLTAAGQINNASAVSNAVVTGVDETNDFVAAAGPDNGGFTTNLAGAGIEGPDALYTNGNMVYILRVTSGTLASYTYFDLNIEAIDQIANYGNL